MKKNSIYLLLIFLAFAFQHLYANPSWEAVLGGTVLAPPQATSWGFVTISEGNFLNAFTEQGTVIWQKKLKSKPSQYYYINRDDFIYLVYDNKRKFALFNPSGVKLWERTITDKICEKPFSGRDDRVFISTKNNISCYGINGIRKWKLATSSANTHFELLELNDGSLLRILENTGNGNTCAIRISPYGGIIEEIQFSETVTNCYSFYQGIILIYSNGDIKCWTVKDNTTICLWTLSKQDFNSTSTQKKLIIGKGSFCIVYKKPNMSSISLCCINSTTQKKIWEKDITDLHINGKETFFYINGEFIFSSQGYSISFNETDGTIAWKKFLKEPKNHNFFTISKSGYAIYTTSDWTILGYRLYQKISSNLDCSTIKKNSYPVFPFPTKKEYPSLKTISQAFSTGDYGEQELVYKWYLEKQKELVLKDLYTQTTSKNILLDTEFPLVIAKSGTSEYNAIIATMIAKSNNSSITQHALLAASILGYDKDGKILTAIENLFSTKKNYDTPKTIICGIDAIYSICRYMGRSEFNNQGKNILMKAIANGDKNIRQYTILTFEKILNLKM
ncbi:MAG: hypothetical protein BKP49_01675 [Treponema sp. CETP13]|nr:MAG: hypothetical protein BKP49_01675 [Treponema sp. CETP13]